MGRGAWLLPVVVYGFLWFILINRLRIAWANDPQYGYGWAVPFLCVYLIWRRVTHHGSQTKDDGRRTTDHKPQTTDLRPLPSAFSSRPSSIFYLLLALLAFLYAPIRLVQAANPVWTLVSWGLALVVISLTLCFISFQTDWVPRGLAARKLIFPIGFFLVAVPWPSVIEQPLIQGLTRLDARATVEMVGWLGIPAVQHGNVIEVVTGEVGINDACSGIRSFQATLMISLFLGELCRLSSARRVALCLGGFAMSLLFNLVRMSLLVWVAASKGIAAIDAWHDPAGVSILLTCFGGLWALAILLGKRAVPDFAQNSDLSNQVSDLKPTCSARPQSHVSSSWAVFALGGWIALTEIGVESWYRIHEVNLSPTKAWMVHWPADNPTLKKLPIAASALKTLKCDEHLSASWKQGARQWQAIFLRWNPETLVQLAHTPNNCMTAAGHTLKTISVCKWFEIDGLRLPFTTFEVMDSPQPFFIFYCLWNDQLSPLGPRATSLWLSGNRMAPVLTGMRNSGNRSLEIAVSGVNSADEANSAVRAELAKILIVTSTPPPVARP